MRDFTTEFQNFIDDMLNDVIIDLKENNPEYAKCKMYIQENGDKVRAIIDGLPKDKRKLLNKYEANDFNRIAIEQGEFYYRGFRDCIKLLKWLRIIWNWKGGSKFEYI